MKQKIGRKNFIRITAILVAVVLVVSFASIFVSNNVHSQIVKYNVLTIEELGHHDCTALNATINSRWSFLNAIADVIEQNGIAAISVIPDFLHAEVGRVPDAKSLALMDEDGNLYSNNGLIRFNEEVYAASAAADGNFAVRYNSNGVILEERKERLVFGVPMDYSIDGVRFTALTAELDVNTLTDEMKLDSYNRRGFSTVIDLSGNYVVNVSKKHSYLTFDNFFNELAGGKLEGATSVDDFRQKIADCQIDAHVTLIYENEGESNVLVVTPLGISDWFFVTSVPSSVFSAQADSIIRVVGILLGVVSLALVAVAAFVLFARQQAAELKNKAQIEEMNTKLQQEHTALEDALGMAQSANRAKTVFLNSMSHDIRTPMNAIIGYTGLAAKHINDKATLTDYLGKIRQSGEHLMSLINDVLDMSRIESGKMTLNEMPESLPEILKALRNIVQADVSAKQLNFFIDAVDVTDENVVCDKLRLNQVLLNILSNAIKYTHPGGNISLRIIETQQADENGRAHFEFRVKDNGIGMSEEYLKTVFDPFTREKTSTVSGIQGTGLGMAITKNIVNMMNGSISVSSKLNEGSEFVVNLAFMISEQTKALKPLEKLNGLRGMVVDDDMNACQSVSQMLRQIGIRTEWCMYGKEAVARTEEAVRIGDSFKVYIIDWLMPDMNGIETARRIRSVVGSDVPIIILTAYDWADIEDEARSAGVTVFVSKPLFQSDLHRTLSEACGVTSRIVEEESGEADFSGKRILLVEDNELNREIATEILVEAGFEIDAAEDGSIAVEKVKASSIGQYDLILMDIQMPNMDGYEATRAIRALPESFHSNIPIIAMTANAFDEDKQKAVEAGMNAHIAKPFEIEKLFSTLKSILK